MFDTVDDVRTALEKLACEYEPALLDAAGAVRMLGELGVIRRLTDGLIARTAQRVEQSKACERRGDRDAASTCAALLGGATGEARRAIEIAHKLEHNDVLDGAMRRGEVTTKQAAMIADATNNDPTQTTELLAKVPEGLTKLRDACQATRATRESDTQRSARYRRSRFCRIWTESDGMVHGAFAVPPEHGGQIKTLIDNGVRRMFRERRRSGEHEPLDAYAADVLCDLLLGTPHTEPAPSEPNNPPEPSEASEKKPARRPYQPTTATHIVIDFDVLVAGNHLPGKRCEIPGVGPVNVEWVKSILGDTFLTAVIQRGTDITTVAHFGRKINAKLRTALLVQGAECVVCSHRGYLEIDHHHDLAKGGPTSLTNLGPLCWICHHRKSNGWKLGPPDPTTGRRTLTPPAHAGPDG